jgi:hypothetical protein
MNNCERAKFNRNTKDKGGINRGNITTKPHLYGFVDNAGTRFPEKEACCGCGLLHGWDSDLSGTRLRSSEYHGNGTR